LSHAEVLHEKERKELMGIFTEKTNKMAELEQNLEALRLKRSTVPAQAFINFENAPLESEKLETSVSEVVNEAQSAARDEIAEESAPALESVAISEIQEVPATAELINENPEGDNEKMERETLSVHILKFMPSNNEILPSLFITWEHETFPRQYSPIVSDGIFDSKSVHELIEPPQNVSIATSLNLIWKFLGRQF